ncbi:GntR family transcriptional regulator [Micromonospora sp. NBC_01813]|uniref:GntR family transcriptional regulator n=1 Tax=Micromonospora sp. NBC_01813 TaxID=2975988 RepID=UPI002DD87262|nr:GntR family transcriptional regulator [Micromonospora sp. NBC_01813]WSA08987.1 GntR family transcriptional regulator [Micromonospora sp. NBC_01813]
MTSFAGISGTVHERVRDWMRSAIVNGTLKPGSRIVQIDIARMLGVSPTPVREAMRDLAAEGLIKVHARKVATVTAIDANELRDIRLLRETLEALAARLCAERITEAELAEAERMQEEMERDPDLSKYVELNRAFHVFLYNAARSPRLTQMLLSLRTATPGMLSVAFTRSKERRLDGLDEHRRFLKACGDRDLDAAEAIFRTHSSVAFDEMEAFLEHRPID